jgi:hypothetical protein
MLSLCAVNSHPTDYGRGRTSISLDGRIIVASNLYDGFDCYDIKTQTWVHTFHTRITHNVPIPVEFIQDDSALLFGSSCGDVAVWELKSRNWLASLRHSGEQSY